MPELAGLAHFHLLRPWWLLALPPLLVLIVYQWRGRDELRRWRGTIAPHLLQHILIRGGRSSWFNPVSVVTLMYVLMVLHLSGPSWEQQAAPFARDEAALLIAIDASLSMDETDIQPSRLERAKQKVQDLLKLRAGSRSGLLVYSGSAHSVIPLTSDMDIVNNFLGAIESEMMPRPGKRADTVLELADRILDDTSAPATLLLVTDAIAGESVPAIRDYFADGRRQLLILGVGSRADDDSQAPRFPLDNRGLQSLADDAGGYYQELTLDDSDVRRLNRRVDNHLVIAEDSDRPWIDAGYYFTLPAVPLFLLWFRRGWTLQWCLLLSLALGSVYTRPVAADTSLLDWWLTEDQQGRLLFERGEYLLAAQRFRDPMWKGIAYYRNEDFDLAAEIFGTVDTVDGLFNLANAWAHSRNYVLAVRTYDQVLARSGSHAGARGNRQIVQAIIDEINAMSESQQAEAGEQSRELGEAPQTADGAEREMFEQQELRQFTADELLADPALSEMWMRQVQQNPARFLSLKFHMQLLNRQQSQAVEADPDAD